MLICPTLFTPIGKNCFSLRDWSLFTAGGGGGGGKGQDIEFECKQLEGGGKISMHSFRGGQNLSAQVWRGGGQKRSARLSRGACFGCERFSEFHQPHPPAVNNDHSLINGMFCPTSVTFRDLMYMFLLHVTEIEWCYSVMIRGQ